MTSEAAIAAAAREMAPRVLSEDFDDLNPYRRRALLIDARAIVEAAEAAGDLA